MGSGFNAELAELMRRAQTGCKTSYRSLLKQVSPRLSAYVQRRVSDRALAEDIVQQMLMKLHQSRHSYDPTLPFEPWLFAVARSVLATALKGHGKMRAVLQFEEDLSEHAGASEGVAMSEARASLESAYSRLTDEQRRVIELAKVEGLSMEEGARRDGTSVGAFKVRVHRAYRALKMALAEDDEAS